MSNRVLHVFNAMNVGGAETMVLNLYRAIDRDKVQFDFLVHSNTVGYYEKEIIALGGRIFRLPSPGINQMKNYRKQLFQLLLENKFSAIHSHPHSFSGFILDVARKAQIPVRIAHSHTTSDGKKETLLRQVYLTYSRRSILKNATHLFSCSITAGESLFGKGRQSFVLPNSINLQDYLRLSVKNNSRTGEELVVGHVGRFDAVKNHPFFLEVFYHFHKKYPHATAVLVGDGPDKEKIIGIINYYQLQDSVKLLGIRSDIPEILSKMDIFLFPSFYEGLGNVVIEAQAAGVPCLVSNTVPTEVDLSMDLVTFKHLEDGAESWADRIADIVKKERPNWNERKRNLKRLGYDVVDNAKYLEEIYCGY